MPTSLVLIAAAVAALCIGQVSAGSEPFAEFLKRVEYRDPQTQAIRAIRATEKNRVYGAVKVEVKGDTATFEYWYGSKMKIKDQSIAFQFPVTKEVSLEVNRIRNFEEMSSLKAKADAAAVAYHTFVASNFRLHVGDSLEKADAQMGVPKKELPLQAAWGGRRHYQYEDGLQVSFVNGAVEKAWRDERK